MLTVLWLILKRSVVFLVIAGLLITAFLYFSPQFGDKPKNESLAKIEASPHQQNGKFQNLIDTVLDTRQAGESMDILQFSFSPDKKNPSEPLPSNRFNAAAFKAGEYVWFGHSTIMLRNTEVTVLADPVFNRASPIPVSGKPFAMIQTPTVDDLPDIDVVIMSHDHYDHLDYKAISDLTSRVILFLVPLGIQPNLEHWGVAADKIVELDWYQEHQIGNTLFTRHFSGRGITNCDSTLWGAWVIKHQDSSVFFSGDSGYFDEFKKIGDQYGPFDIAFIENGAYDKACSQIHMMP